MRFRDRVRRSFLGILLLTGTPAVSRADMAPEYHPHGKEALSNSLVGACMNGEVEKARKLLKRGADPKWEKPSEYQTDAMSTENGPAYLSAIRENHLDVLRMMLEEQPKLVQTLGARMLHAVLTGMPWKHDSATDQQFLKLLIEKKVELNPPGDTPLMLAAQTANIEAVKLLLAAGADASRKGKDGKTALQKAQQAKPQKPAHAEIIKLLEPKK